MIKRIKFYQIAVIGIAFMATLIFLLPAKAQQQSQFDYVDLAPLDNVRKDGHPKMDSVLYRLAKAYTSGGLEEAKAFVRMRGIDLKGEAVRVVLEGQMPAGGAAAARIAGTIVKTCVQKAGGIVEAAFRQSVQCSVPLHSLQDLADSEFVRYMRRPLKPHITETSEGVAASGANKWRPLTPFHTTEPVRVCILDAGFDGYQGLLGSDLPASVTTRSFRADGDIFAGQKHGAGCAEIVHDMAPGAELYLVNFQTFTELQNAVQWIVGEKCDVISYSMGSYIAGRGDGTGPYTELAKYVHDAGLIWVTSAGNAADDHWQGNFNDVDSDNWHNFSGGDEILTFTVPAYAVISAYLKWDDWGAWNGYSYGGSNQDYDLYLYYYNGSSWVYVDHSSNDQTGTQWPSEGIAGWYSNSEMNWGIAIYKSSATQNLKMDLYIPTHKGDLEYNVPAGSLTAPSDIPHIISVGAVHWSDFGYHYYSSRGPTMDGRIKPDLCAPSGVSCVSYGSYSFFGTSAACPHAAGAIALMKMKTPFYLGQIVDMLEERAGDLGPAGKDNQFGFGRLKLD